MTTHLKSLESQLQDVNQMIANGDDSTKVINKKAEIEAMIRCVNQLRERKFYFLDKF